MCPGEYTARATLSPSRSVPSKSPSRMCQPTSPVQSPSVGGLRKTHGHAASQLHDSRYWPDTFQPTWVSLIDVLPARLGAGDQRKFKEHSKAMTDGPRASY